jgi:hypothetical protein
MTEVAYTEDEIALEFAARYEGELVYVTNSTAAVARRWYVKSETGGWHQDMTYWVQWLIRQHCAEIRERCGDAEIINRLSSQLTFLHIELLCRSDPRLVRTREEVGFPPNTTKKRKKATDEVDVA